MTFNNRLVSLSSIDDDGIDHSNGHINTTNCEVIFDVNVLSANFNKSKEGNVNYQSTQLLILTIMIRVREVNDIERVSTIYGSRSKTSVVTNSETSSIDNIKGTYY